MNISVLCSAMCRLSTIQYGMSDSTRQEQVLLELRGTQVRDLSPLRTLANLDYLYIENTPVTLATARKLRQALPNCNIRQSLESH